MKYHYHKLEAYLSFDNLHKHVKNLLDGFGTNYDINFKQVLNTINSAIKFETIPTVCENLQSLFLKMNIKFPTKI